MSAELLDAHSYQSLRPDFFRSATQKRFANAHFIGYGIPLELHQVTDHGGAQDASKSDTEGIVTFE
jgi:hypothetical protein